MFTSCGNLKFVGNPEPKLKTIHMWEQHRGYTIEEYNNHPDRNCEDMKL